MCRDDELRSIEATAIARQLERQQLQLLEEKRQQKLFEEQERLATGKALLREARSRKEEIKRLKMLVLTGAVSDASATVKSLQDRR